MSEHGWDGQRVVLTMYGLLVAVAAAVGVLLAAIVEGLRGPSLFFLIDLPPTPLGMAVYGAVTVATVFGVPLVLVILVSRRIDESEDGPPADTSGGTTDEEPAESTEPSRSDGE